MRKSTLSFVLIALSLCPLWAHAQAPRSAGGSKASVYALQFKTIDGKDLKLADYAGKVLLIVNTASGCGYTPQLKNLVNLKKKYGSQGFEVLAFPSNDFKQEKSNAEEIQKFATETYQINFPLMSEGSVTGQSPLFKLLTDATGGVPKDVAWNFEKFLVGRDGVPAARFRSKVLPDAPVVMKEIERLLSVSHAEKPAGVSK